VPKFAFYKEAFLEESSSEEEGHIVIYQDQYLSRNVTVFPKSFKSPSLGISYEVCF
jgi:hypothetical protein